MLGYQVRLYCVGRLEKKIVSLSRNFPKRICVPKSCRNKQTICCLDDVYSGVFDMITDRESWTRNCGGPWRPDIQRLSWGPGTTLILQSAQDIDNLSTQNSIVLNTSNNKDWPKESIVVGVHIYKRLLVPQEKESALGESYQFTLIYWAM